MTRRDVCAMSLALECLRWGARYDRDLYCVATSQADRVLGAGSVTSATVKVALWCARHVPDRLLRARVAIALRVLLRVADGDYGPRERWLQCNRCWRIERDLDSDAARQGVCVPYPRNGRPDCPGHSHAPAYLTPMQWPLPPHRTVRPLWEQAPAWSPEVTPRQRRGR